MVAVIFIARLLSSSSCHSRRYRRRLRWRTSHRVALLLLLLWVRGARIGPPNGGGNTGVAAGPHGVAASVVASAAGEVPGQLCDPVIDVSTVLYKFEGTETHLLAVGGCGTVGGVLWEVHASL
jgi:hypothetical protein